MPPISTFRYLLQQLKTGTSSVLEISSDKFEHYGRDELAQVEAAARGNPHITTLELYCYTQGGTVEKINFAPLLKALSANLPSATTLLLVTDRSESLRSGNLQGSEHFTSISVTLFSSFVEVPLGLAVCHHTSLRSLQFKSPWGVTLSDLHLLPSSLVDIHLDSVKIRAESFQFLIRPTLSSLSINRFHFFSVAESQALARALQQSNLRHLKLFDCTSRRLENIGAVYEAFENMTTLVSLSLQLVAGAGGVRPVNLATLIRSNTGLKELRLEGRQGIPPAVANKNVVAFVAALADPRCCLTRLDLIRGISANLAHTLLAVLKRVPPSSLRHLSLRYSEYVYGADIDDKLERTVSLMEGFFSLPFISLTLELDSDVGQMSCLRGQTLVRNLRTNYTLESLGTNIVDSVILSRLQSICRLNAAGRCYLKTGNAASRNCGVEVLIKVKDELDDVFTHLVENPSLCNRVSDDSVTPAL